MNSSSEIESKEKEESKQEDEIKEGLDAEQKSGADREHKKEENPDEMEIVMEFAYGLDRERERKLQAVFAPRPDYHSEALLKIVANHEQKEKDQEVGAKKQDEQASKPEAEQKSGADHEHIKKEQNPDDLDNDLIEFALQLEEQRKEALLAACFRPRELNYDQECEAIFLKIKTYLEEEYEKEMNDGGHEIMKKMWQKWGNLWRQEALLVEAIAMCADLDDIASFYASCELVFKKKWDATFKSPRGNRASVVKLS